MKNIFFNIKAFIRLSACHILAFLTFFLTIPLYGQTGGEKAVEELLNMGFENIRWTENESERIYTIENNVYKAQGVGISKAIGIIQEKECRTIKYVKLLLHI